MTRTMRAPAMMQAPCPSLASALQEAAGAPWQQLVRIAECHSKVDEATCKVHDLLRLHILHTHPAYMPLIAGMIGRLSCDACGAGQLGTVGRQLGAILSSIVSGLRTMKKESGKQSTKIYDLVFGKLVSPDRSRRLHLHLPHNQAAICEHSARTF